MAAVRAKLIAAFVFRMARMAFNPFPFDLMRPQCGIETFPQNRRSSPVLSAVFQPRFFQLWIHCVMPRRTYWLSVLEYHFTLFFQGFQRNDCRHQLHAIISGEVVALAKGFRARDSVKSPHNYPTPDFPGQEPSVKISTCLSISGRLPVLTKSKSNDKSDINDRYEHWNYTTDRPRYRKPPV